MRKDRKFRRKRSQAEEALEEEAHKKVRLVELQRVVVHLVLVRLVLVHLLRARAHFRTSSGRVQDEFA
jgi:hypothetical protein